MTCTWWGHCENKASRTLFDLINLKIITKMGPFLGFFLGCFLVRTHLPWCLFSLKVPYAYPGHKSCVVWASISAPLSSWSCCRIGGTGSLLFGILAITHPCGLWVEDFAGSPSCSLLNIEDRTVTQLWVTSSPPVCFCVSVYIRQKYNRLSVSNYCVSEVFNQLCSWDKEREDF